jgi:L-fucose mutarotase/ribose pyranase (RbsD/FucU family)
MLKNINPLLTGSLLEVLADMGHGDDLVIVDANYPAQSSGVHVLDFPGITATDMAEAVLSLLPLDDFVDKPAAVMQAPNETPAIFKEFESLKDLLFITALAMRSRSFGPVRSGFMAISFSRRVSSALERLN